MTIKTKAIVGLGLVAGLGAAVLPLASYADTDTETAVVRVTVNESITITEIANSALALNFTGADISNGEVLTGDHAVKVVTSSSSGYTLTMQAAAGTLNLRTTVPTPPAQDVFDGAVGFSGIGAGSVVGALATAAYNEATLTTGLTFASSAPTDGVWGYRLAGWTAANYVSVPTTAFTISASNAATASTGQTTTVTFGVQAGTATTEGVYGDYITYVAATN